MTITTDDIGYSSNADDENYSLEDYKRISWVTSPSGGKLDYFYFKTNGTWGVGESGAAAIYESSSKSLIAWTDRFTGNGGIWTSGSFGPSSLISDVDYILLVWGDASNKYIRGDNTVLYGYGHRFNPNGWVKSGNGDVPTYFDPLDDSVFTKLYTRTMEMYATYYFNPVLSNPSGVLNISELSATLTHKVTAQTGNCWIYYGKTDGGVDQSAWTYSANCGNQTEYFTSGITGLSKATTYYYRGYISSSRCGSNWSPISYQFSTPYGEGESLKIYYSCNRYPIHYLQCWCTRWTEDNWGVTIETFLTSSSRNTLFKYVVPGAYRERNKILGIPTYIDTTYTSSNTLRIEPTSGFGLSSLRQSRTIVVKNISDTFLTPKLFHVKIEGVRLDT